MYETLNIYSISRCLNEVSFFSLSAERCKNASTGLFTLFMIDSSFD